MAFHVADRMKFRFVDEMIRDPDPQFMRERMFPGTPTCDILLALLRDMEVEGHNTSNPVYLRLFACFENASEYWDTPAPVCLLCVTTQKQLKEHGQRLMICGRCKIATYCCPDCQRIHWKYHKKYCKRSDRSSEE